MTSPIRAQIPFLVAGNWKMNGDLATWRAFLSQLAPFANGEAEVLVCPPAPLLGTVARSGGVKIGGQDCSPRHSGAHTGDVSADLLVDLDCTHVILGHSERRADHGETSETVKAKAEAAIASGLVAIVCIGETKDEREAGNAEKVALDQLGASLPAKATAQNLVIAYEPVWAIGTGLVASTDDIARMHAAIRTALATDLGDGDQVRILYGGSVKPTNAAEIFAVPNVNGALVGGASLKAESFGEIITHATQVD